MPDIDWLKTTGSVTDWSIVNLFSSSLARKNKSKGCAMVQEVIVSLFIEEYRIRYQISHVCCLVQCLTLGQDIPLELQSFLATIISLLLHTCISFVTRQRANLTIGRGIENRVQRTMTNTEQWNELIVTGRGEIRNVIIHIKWKCNKKNMELNIYI